MWVALALACVAPAAADNLTCPSPNPAHCVCDWVHDGKKRCSHDVSSSPALPQPAAAPAPTSTGISLTRAPCGQDGTELAPTQKLAWHEGGPKGLGHLWDPKVSQTDSLSKVSQTDSRGQPMLDQ